jgi:hypothetical protein
MLMVIGRVLLFSISLLIMCGCSWNRDSHEVSPAEGLSRIEAAYTLLIGMNIMDDAPDDGVDADRWVSEQVSAQLRIAMRAEYSNINWGSNMGAEIEMICYVYEAFIVRDGSWAESFNDLPVDDKIESGMVDLIDTIQSVRAGAGSVECIG